MANISYFCTMLHFGKHIAHIHCTILIRSTGSRGKSTFLQSKEKEHPPLFTFFDYILKLSRINKILTTQLKIFILVKNTQYFNSRFSQLQNA